MSKLIEVSGLGVEYSGVRALDDVSFDVNYGDFLAVVGPNGAGKSTLFSCILGLNTEYNGVVRIFGHDVRKSSASLKEVGYVPQSIRFERNFPLTVREVIRLGIWRDTKEERVDEIMQTFHIYDIRKKRIGELSGGQQQRVFIAKAMVNDPKLLILDEPTNGIDQASMTVFHDILKDLNSNHGVTILWSSHDLDAISALTNRVVCIAKKMYYCGPARQFFEDESFVCMRTGEAMSSCMPEYERPHMQNSVNSLMQKKRQQYEKPHIQKITDTSSST